MDLSDFIDIVFNCIDWVRHWRFSFCFLGGIVLTAFVTGGIASGALRGVVGGVVMVTAIVTGFRWECSDDSLR